MRKKNIKPVKPSGFVFHESRVGSTLVANMLAAVPTNIVYSESAPPPAAADGAPAVRYFEYDWSLNKS